MSESGPISDAAPTLDNSPTTSDASSMTDSPSDPSTPDQSAPILGDETVTVTQQEGIRVGELPPPAPDATHVYISLTFTSVERGMAQALIDNARDTVGRERSFSVTFGEALGEE